jgi:hypothetical protein
MSEPDHNCEITGVKAELLEDMTEPDHNCEVTGVKAVRLGRYE